MYRIVTYGRVNRVSNLMGFLTKMIFTTILKFIDAEIVLETQKKKICTQFIKLSLYLLDFNSINSFNSK